MELTEQNERDLHLIMRTYPFRIPYAYKNKDTGEINVLVAKDMRRPNKLCREGHETVIFSGGN